MSIETLLASDLSPSARWDENRWNGWRLKGTRLSYRPFPDRMYAYPIDLECQCTTSARMLDIIMQVAGKTWADDACLAGLIRALDHILRPQANLCSSGIDKPLTKQVLRSLRRPRRQLDGAVSDGV
jgi:hypothetical protein